MHRSVVKHIVAALFLLAMSQFITAGNGEAREITDMAGRRVTVPDTIRKVYAPSTYGCYMLYALAPDMLAGLVHPLRKEEKKYFDKALFDLPVIGALFGQGQTANIENLMKAKPDVLVTWAGKGFAVNDKVEETVKKMGIPFVYVTADSPGDYPDAFLFLGRLLKREKRAERLAGYCRRTLANAKRVVGNIPANKRPSVYYAEGTDGLSTECSGSIHAQVLQLAGDVDVHRCRPSSHKGYEKVSPEQVMLYNPDVIIVQERQFYDRVFTDARWRQVKAVREGRVRLVPGSPFNWFDRPPSFMRILGLKWLMDILYPDQYRIDMVREARDFYRLFLGAEVSERDMRRLLGR